MKLIKVGATAAITYLAMTWVTGLWEHQPIELIRSDGFWRAGWGLMAGFFLGWMKAPGRGRALGVGEVKLTSMIVPTVKKLTYHVHMKRVILRRLVLGVADGFVTADGVPAYEALDMKVGLAKDVGPAGAAA